MISWLPDCCVALGIFCSVEGFSETLVNTEDASQAIAFTFSGLRSIGTLSNVLLFDEPEMQNIAINISENEWN